MSTASHSLDTLTAVRERRTVALPALRPDPIEPDVLNTLLDAMNWAPSHGNTQPWSLAVFTGAGRDRLADVLATSLALHKGQEVTPEALEAQRANQAKAPVWIVVAAQPPAGSKFPPCEEDWATAAAVQTLLLSARALGIGSKWISNVASMHPNTMQSLGFSEDCRPLGMVYLGYVAGEWPQGQRTPVSEKVRWFSEE